jgi:phenylalanyl-tRNA synthetase beta chain
MNVSYRWLKSLVPTLEGTPQEVADRLAMLGAPVDEVVDLGAEIGDVVIARVDEVRPHPNADKLRVCTVDAGTGERLQVVCGAPNVQAGRFYPFAPIGASLPGGIEIKEAKLRGEASEGMLCSARELGLGRDHSGLMTLAGEWEPGTSFRGALGLDDARLVVDVTPNRPELLSHLGIAREAAPNGQTDVRLPEFPNAGEVSVEVRPADASGEVGGVRLSIEDVEGCPRFTAAVIRGVRVGPSPEWLATRLRAVGLRPINNVVDATNYVLHELGQPLHAYDLAKLQGPALRVVRAGPGETFVTLDGVERALELADLMIADAERSVGIAGVMGGENSEVGDGTANVLLECALFDARSVRKTSRRLGLSTDASYRFERGVDPEGQPLALRRTCELIVAVAGGEVVDAIDLNPRPLRRRVLELRPERVAKVLGIALPAGEIASLLTAIGFGVEDVSARPLRVAVPGYRPDVEGEVDLIEEVARRRGYESLPEELGPFRPTEIPEDPAVAVEARVREVFLRWGFFEARTAAFSPVAENAVPLLNPLSQEEGFLRRSLAPGLLRRVEHNFAHGVRDVRLFQVGTVFFPSTDGRQAGEELRLGAAFSGSRRPPHWSGASEPLDTWDLKGLLEDLAREFPGGAVEPGSAWELDALTEDGERFRIVAGGEPVGGGGVVDTGAVDAPAWTSRVYALEARLPAQVPDKRGVKYAALPTFPASERDLALLVGNAVSSADVEATVRDSAGPLLEAAWAFDVYAGKGVPEGTRSVAFRLRFRAADRSVTDAEVERAVERVLRALEERHGVRRR